MLRRLAVSTARVLHLAPDDTVFLEGGLGSQLLGMMIYELRRTEAPATKCDVSYFFPEIREPQSTAGATRWPWELHRYGMDLHDKDFIRSPRYRFRRDYLAQASADERYAHRLAERKWLDLFPLLPSAIARADELCLSDGDGYACVHVRRGDYLKVSSRVITLDESVAMAVRFRALLPKTVLVLSDDEFTSRERASVGALLPDKQCLFITEDDQHVAHGLLRMSRVLITSNSTFSWTAALLMSSADGIALAPEHFFGPSMATVNHIFQGPASWMLITPAR